MISRQKTSFSISIKDVVLHWSPNDIVTMFISGYRETEKTIYIFHHPFCNKYYNTKQNHLTRMHSSRMRTGRSLTVCGRLIPRGGVCLVWGGVVCLVRGGCAWSGGVSALRVCLVWGVVCLVGGCLASQHALRQTPSPPVDRQTPVKTLPWPNFVAAGKYLCKLTHSFFLK